MKTTMMLLMVLARSFNDSSLRMITCGQSYNLSAGQSIVLECQFYADNTFNLFDYPGVWHKRQRHWPHHHHQQQQTWLTEDSDGVEDCQINMMVNLMEPFASLKRYEATFDEQPPKYLFRLSLRGMKIFNHRNW